MRWKLVPWLIVGIALRWQISLSAAGTHDEVSFLQQTCHRAGVAPICQGDLVAH